MLCLIFDIYLRLSNFYVRLEYFARSHSYTLSTLNDIFFQLNLFRLNIQWFCISLLIGRYFFEIVFVGRIFRGGFFEEAKNRLPAAPNS